MTSSGPATRATSFRRIGHAGGRGAADGPGPGERLGLVPPAPWGQVPCGHSVSRHPTLPAAAFAWFMYVVLVELMGTSPAPRSGRPDGHLSNRDRRSVVETTREQARGTDREEGLRTGSYRHDMARARTSPTSDDPARVLTASTASPRRPVDGASDDALAALPCLRRSRRSRCRRAGGRHPPPGLPITYARPDHRAVPPDPAGRGHRPWPRARRPPAGGSSSSSRRPRRRRSPATSAPEFEVEASVGHIRDLPAAERAAGGHEEGSVRQVRRRRRQRLRAVLRRRRRQEEEGRRAEARPQGRRRALPRDRRGPRGRGHRLAPARGAEAQGPGASGWSSTRSPARRSSAPCRTPATSTSGSSTRRRPGASSTGSTATRSRRCCGARSAPGLSAGRVQSVATRLVVERERERMAFRSASYWDVDRHVRRRAAGGRRRTRSPPGCVSVDGAPGRHRPRLRRPRAADGVRTVAACHLDEAGGDAASSRRSARRRLRGALASRRSRTPAARRRRSRPRPCSRRRAASCGSRRARRCGSRRGCTRTATSPTCVPTRRRCREQAIGAARRQAAELYGPEYVPDRPRVYASKAKNAQEAHEAIRPSGDAFRTPAQVSGRAARRRVPALRADLEAHGRLPDGRRAGLDRHRPPRRARRRRRPRRCEFSASGTVITFRGFLAAYEEGRDDDRDDAADARTTSSGGCRRSRRATRLDAARPEADGHETTPPPRYTEASLVKALEERGIGRPVDVRADHPASSRTAATSTTKGSALVPTWLAFAVTRLLEEHFGRLVDYDFTAAMEDDLDRSPPGEEDRVALAVAVLLRRRRTGGPEGCAASVDDLGDIDARDINSVPIGDGHRAARRPVRPVPRGAGRGRRGAAPRLRARRRRARRAHRREGARAARDQADGDRVLGTDPDTGRRSWRATAGSART